MNPILQIENISKLYKIEHKQLPYQTISDSLRNLFSTTSSKEKFYALKDVSFNVFQGEAVGIIGKNGAGKSTLLKILSRITYPSSGRILCRGRIASLLEVGTGFHPELTGRENIYLNGSILGLKRREIIKKFDQIVDFSGVEKFLDTPLKHYSSGMQLRLAFAVAAHLDPEILIIDEVLAVGDAEFQKKCIGKMEEVSKKYGNTILFVSHNMQVIRRLCQKGILLSKGEVKVTGSIEQVTEAYLDENTLFTGLDNIAQILNQLPQDSTMHINDIKLYQTGLVTDTILNHLPLDIEINYSVFQKTEGLRVFFDLCDDEDNIILRSFNDEDNDSIPVTLPGDYVTRARIPDNFLGPIPYKLKIQATVFNKKMCTPEGGIVLPLHVELTGDYNRAYAMDAFRSKLAMKINWQTVKA